MLADQLLTGRFPFWEDVRNETLSDVWKVLLPGRQQLLCTAAAAPGVAASRGSEGWQGQMSGEGWESREMWSG